MKPHYTIPPVPGSIEAQELLAMETENASATPWPGSNPNKANEGFISPAEKEKFLKKTPTERVTCQQCGASYEAKWTGTTCSVCDGDIA